ncbi:hypothetical protein GY45DRAFT_387003 [Cubamyces sp. BRFM 1775]|nr:hypothetical protein GY45DRAFT_387003 [Cubamyces sp. BRFM 1775]
MIDTLIRVILACAMAFPSHALARIYHRSRNSQRWNGEPTNVYACTSITLEFTHFQLHISHTVWTLLYFEKLSHDPFELVIVHRTDVLCTYLGLTESSQIYHCQCATIHEDDLSHSVYIQEIRSYSLVSGFVL